MTDDILREAFDGVRASEELKEHTKSFLMNRAGGYRKKKKSPYRYGILAAAVLLFLSLGGYWYCFVPVARISIEINPSLELGISRLDRVVSVEGRNEDGEKLAAGLDIKNMVYTRAVEEILGQETVSGLLEQDEILTVSVVGAEGEQTARLLSGVEACLSGKRNTYCCYLSPEEAGAAAETGLTYGKYRAYLEIQGLFPDITTEEIRNMTMREIRELLEKVSGEENGRLGDGNGYRYQGGRNPKLSDTAE